MRLTALSSMSFRYIQLATDVEKV